MAVEVEDKHCIVGLFEQRPVALLALLQHLLCHLAPGGVAHRRLEAAYMLAILKQDDHLFNPDFVAISGKHGELQTCLAGARPILLAVKRFDLFLPRRRNEIREVPAGDLLRHVAEELVDARIHVGQVTISVSGVDDIACRLYNLLKAQESG